MEVCKREHKKFKKTVFKTETPKFDKNKADLENVPLWFDKKIEKDEENLQELDDLLKEFN